MGLNLQATIGLNSTQFERGMSRVRVGGLASRHVRVSESAQGCTLVLPCASKPPGQRCGNSWGENRHSQTNQRKKATKRSKRMQR